MYILKFKFTFKFFFTLCLLHHTYISLAEVYFASDQLLIHSKKDINDVRYYKPRIIPNVPIKDTDIFVYPLYGDRFDTIAQRYYNDSNLWWIIAKANEISNGKISPDPLKKLRIPTEIDDIIESINNAN